MNYTVIDLELNQPSNTIISIGVVVGDVHNNEIKERYHRYIKTSERIAPEITELTGIHDEHIILEGIPLEEAYKEIAALHVKHECFMNPLTWGGADTDLLRKQLEAKGALVNGWCYGRRFIDTKTLYQTYALSNNLAYAGGLSRCAKRLGLNFKGRKHNALDDSINTFHVAHILFGKMKEKKK